MEFLVGTREDPASTRGMWRDGLAMSEHGNDVLGTGESNGAPAATRTRDPRLRRPVVGSVMALRLSWPCPTWTGKSGERPEVASK